MALLLASDFDQSRFFSAENYGERDRKFRTKETTSEEIMNRKTGKLENRLILWFTNDKRGLVLNRTNIRTLKAAFGDPLAGWIDKIIVIFKVSTEMGPGLRVRFPPPKQAAAAPQQPVAPPQPPAAAPPAAATAPQQTISGNGANAPLPAGNGAAAAPAAAVEDPDLEDDPVLSLSDELDDEVGF